MVDSVIDKFGRRVEQRVPDEGAALVLYVVSYRRPGRILLHAMW